MKLKAFATSILSLCGACVSAPSQNENSQPQVNNSSPQAKVSADAVKGALDLPLNEKTLPAQVRVKTFAFKHRSPVGTVFYPKKFSFSEGGWSAASRVEKTPGNFAANEIWTVNDRGLNLYLEAKDSKGNVKFKDGDRYFPVPAFNQSIFRLQLKDNGEGEIVEQIGLKYLGAPTNGLPSSLLELATGEHGYGFKPAKGPFFSLTRTPRGFDFEGLAQTFNAEGKPEFWLVEEYGPSILRSDAQGNINQRWSPSKQADIEAHSLPWVLRHRADNRGFEGLTVSGRYVLAALQSPLDAKGGASGEKGHGNKDTPIHRIVRINRDNGSVEQFAYNHSEKAALGIKHKDVKIGDLAALDTSGNRFLILEHSNSRKHLVLIEAVINETTTRLGNSVGYESGKLPYKPLESRVIADLAPLLVGLELPEKAEGITFFNSNTLVIVFDDDFCVDAALADKPAAKECENLAVTIEFPTPLFASN